ncbi:MAG: 50S ribosomal protein L3 [Pirellulales bacterium]|nr:50S ribosomal protein L3 [Pirellulales bacterium]
MTKDVLLALADEASISEKNMAAEDQKDETPESQSDSDASAVATAPEPAEMGRKGLLGRKVGMTQVFDDDGTVVPVTVIEAGPCTVLLSRSAERDGYDAIQVGYRDKPRRLASRSVRGQVVKLDSKRAKKRSHAGVEMVAKADCEPQRFVREFRGETKARVGQKITVAVFEGCDAVDVIGVSKGRGTAGVMKRHGFSGQRASHGVKKVHRHQGGTGMCQSPGRLFKGKKMAGRFGNERSTMRNLRLVDIDSDRNLLVVRGAVPGPNGGYVVVRQTNKVKRSGGVGTPTTKKKGAK